MINFDYITKETIKEYYSNWPQVSDHPYIILITLVLDPEKQIHY